jgi:hypothetical protein
MNHSLLAPKRALGCLFFLGAVLGSTPAFAQSSTVENEGGIWFAATAQKKVFKGFEIELTPELRTVGFDVDKVLLGFGARYKVIDYLSLRTGYRGGFADDKGTVVADRRFNFDVVGSVSLGDFKPSARFRYTDSFGPSIESEHVFRYKGALDYDIGKTDVSVSGFAEAFHELNTGEFSKMRYGVGVEWAFSKTKTVDQAIGLGYHLDYHLTKYKNVHIADLSYKLEF